MPATNVKSRWSGGDLYFYDKAGAEIAHYDGTNRKLIVPSGSALEVDGVAVDSSTLALNGLTASAAELNKLDGAGAVVASGTQVAHIADPAGAVTDQDDEARTAIAAIIDALEAFGIAATS